ncbi:MAG TPA: ABC transporter permease [Gemmatimonadaceae bacterium]|nr:ABC transporter permease [Gemmatimonadaceae bacterium]
MPPIPGIRRLMRLDRDTAGLQRAVDDELQFHFDMTMRELMAKGMSPEEARREARRRFGDVQIARERLTTIDEARAVRERRTEWWSAFAQDLRYAVRGLRLKPWFAAAVIATLGLGIGANAAMFGIVDRLLFRPPRFLSAPDRASRLYLVRTSRGKEVTGSTEFGYRRYLDFRAMTKSFDAMTPFYTNAYAVGAGDATRTMPIAISGADLWKMFDVKPVIGRFFTPDEDTPPAGARVIVLSYAFWQTQFGGRSSALGAPIDIGAWRFTIIGVAPEGFSGFARSPVAAFVPTSAVSSSIFNGRFPWYSSYSISWFDTFARRKPGVTIAAANADLTAAFQQSYKLELAANPKGTKLEIARPHAFAGPVLLDRGPNESSEAKVATWLIGVTAIVLLIACANVGNLLLARALRRRREIALRIALGVSRGRLLMQLLTESVLLAVLGGAAGLLIAQWGGSIMGKTLLARSDGANAVTDGRVLLVVAVLAVVAGLLTGLAPAFQTGRGDIAASLKAGAREGTVQRSRLRAALLVTQAALSVVLLIGAGLFVRSLVNVKNVRMGYDVDRLLWVNTNLRGLKLDSVRYVQLQEQLRDRAEQVPEVEHAARALTAPFWSYWSFSLYVEGIDSVAKLGDFTAQVATPEFFATTGTRLLRGRGIATDDRESAPRVIVVGESMAKRLWPGQDAIGKCVRVEADTAPCASVVGVAEDVRLENVGKTQMHYYMPLAQFHRYSIGTGIFVRTKGRATTHADEVRHALQQLMPGTSYVTVTPMTTMVAPQLRSWTVGATMFTIFGLLALVLAAVGLYSVIAYNVAQRTHEMGVRIALGAQSRDVVRLIVREGVRIVVPGVVLGAAIALVAGRWVAPLLFEVSPKDPPVMAAVVGVLIAVAIVASWLPAARAARVDPIQALRAD